MSDHVFIEELRFQAIVGIRPSERLLPQTVSMDIDMHVDTRDAASSGDLAKSVDYGDVARRIEAFVVRERFELLETLAERCVQLLLDTTPAHAVTLTARKPDALSNAIVGVRVFRERS